MLSYLAYIAKFFLLFSQELIPPFLILGYIWGNRKFFYQLGCLILFSTIFNIALKETFMIPFSPPLKGFAFPSGHMQTATVLYGLLIFQTKKRWLQGVLCGLLVGIALGLLYFGYHNCIDIVGAVFFALLLIIFYYLFLSSSKYFSWIITSLSLSLIIYIGFHTCFSPNLWVAICGLGGLLVANNFFGLEHSTFFKSLFGKFLTSAIFFTLFYGIKHLFALPLF